MNVGLARIQKYVLILGIADKEFLVEKIAEDKPLHPLIAVRTVAETWAWGNGVALAMVQHSQDDKLAVNPYKPGFGAKENAIALTTSLEVN